MERSYFLLYLFFHTKPVIIARLFIFLFFLVLFILNITNIDFLKNLLFFYFVFAVNEIFIQEKLNSMRPQSVGQDKSPINEVAFETRLILVTHSNIFDALKVLARKKDIEFLLGRIGSGDFPNADVSLGTILEKSQMLSKMNNGQFITNADIVTAYLLLTEPKTKFLVKHELTEKDLEYIYKWTRNTFYPDPSKKTRSLPATGIFDTLMSGWNYELKKYAYNLTEAIVFQKHVPQVSPKDKEFRELSGALAKSSSSNVMMVGETGVGKRSLVQYFAYQSYFRHLEDTLNGKVVYELYVDRLLSGIQNAGELEERLQYLFEELVHTGEVVVFIENIENLFGGGGLNFDAGGVISHYLESSHIKIIGTSSPFAYKTFIESKDEIKQYFVEVRIAEKTEDQTLQIITEDVGQFEGQYGIWVLFEALKEAVKLSSSYYPDRYLPVRAINLLEESLSEAKLSKKKVLTKHDVRSVVGAKTHILSEEPTQDEKELLLHLEDKIHEKLIDQEEAVTAIAKALRRLRSGFEKGHRPISTFLFLGPTGVGKTETAKRLAELYFGSEDTMIRLDMSEYQTQDSIRKILGEQPGEEVVTEALVDQIMEKPFALLLLDEFEKAYPSILDLFLQVFDEGRLTDNRGRTVSFTNTIIIATSNAGSELIREQMGAGLPVDDIKKQLIDALLKSGQFRPELINRFDEVVVFKPLDQNHSRDIARLILTDALKKLDDDQIQLTFDESVLTKVAQEGFDEQFGARNVRRYIENTIEDFLSRAILEGTLTKGEPHVLAVDENGNFVIR